MTLYEDSVYLTIPFDKLLARFAAFFLLSFRRYAKRISRTFRERNGGTFAGLFSGARRTGIVPVPKYTRVVVCSPSKLEQFMATKIRRNIRPTTLPASGFFLADLATTMPSVFVNRSSGYAQRENENLCLAIENNY